MLLSAWYLVQSEHWYQENHNKKRKITQKALCNEAKRFLYYIIYAKIILKVCCIMDAFTAKIFRNKVFVKDKMTKFGFKTAGQCFVYSQKLLDNQFELQIFVSLPKNIETKLIDTSSKDLYTLHLLNTASGTFVGEVREGYENTLIQIAENCCKDTFFMTAQANRITEMIKKRFNTTPEFLWKKFPGFGVFRNTESQKWYGLISNIDKSRLEKNNKGTVEILNIKLDCAEIADLHKCKGFYPAYHMNKKNWITILLDETIKDEKIMELIEKSYKFSEQKNKKG